MPCRLLAVTDIPYWRRGRGAHQRIERLFRYLSQSPIELVVLYLGPIEEADRRAWPNVPGRLVELRCDLPPEGFSRRMAWHIAGTMHALGRAWRATVSRQLARVTRSHRESGQVRPRRLADFRWPPAHIHFRRLLLELRPDAVLVEYAYLVSLVNEIPQPDSAGSHAAAPAGPYSAAPPSVGRTARRPRLAVDTHDILSRRAAEFRAAGATMFLDIRQDEEIAALKRFDLIVAIQNEEADTLRQWLPQSHIMVVGHTPLEGPIAALESGAAARRTAGCTVGHFAADSPLNAEAIQWFHRDCWPQIVLRAGRPVRLLVAGSICRMLQGTPIARDANVTLDEALSDADKFHRQVDVVINPIRLGTGLKIKNIEAICAGMPLVTTPHGAAGLPTSPVPYFAVGATAVEFADAVVRLVADPVLCRTLGEAARRVASHQMHPDQVYGPLRQWVLESGESAP